jgi:hypothetical protein
MRPSSLILRDTFETKADYGKIVSYFKSRLNQTYYKGYIEKDEVQLFYYSEIFRRPGSSRLPIVQFNMTNKVDSKGSIKIKFKIVAIALILFVLGNGFVIFFSISGVVPGTVTPLPTVIPIVTLVFSYCFLLTMYLVERSRFKKEIEQWELT